MSVGSDPGPDYDGAAARRHCRSSALTSTLRARRWVRAYEQYRNPHRGSHRPPPVPAVLGLEPEPGATHGTAETEAIGDDCEYVIARARGLVDGHPAGTHRQPPARPGSELRAARTSAELEVVGDDHEDVHVHARARRVVNGRPAGALIVKTKVLLLVLVMSARPCVHMRGDEDESVRTKM